MKKLFVWDFHGVLEKGTELAAGEISNTILKKYGYKQRFSEQQILDFYGLKWYQYFENLLPAETYERHLELQEACYVYGDNYPDVITRNLMPNDFAHEVLEQIGVFHTQILISNTKASSLDFFVKHVDVEKYFLPHIYATTDNKKETKLTKKDVLKTFLKNKSFDQIVIIGDSSADMDMKDVAGGITYLYSHPSRSQKDIKADFKITNLKEVLNEI